MPSTFSRRSFFRYSAIAGGAAGALGGAGLLAACSSSSSASGTSADSTDPKVQLSWQKNVEFAGEYMAIEGGYFKAAGLGTPQLIAGGGSGTGVETGLTSNKVWTGLTSPLLTAPVVLKGAKLTTIGATYQKNPFCITSPATAPINSPQEMKGKKIGVAAGNTSPFNALLAANGLTTNDVQVVSVQYDPTPLVQGQIDGLVAYITNEPIALADKGFQTHSFLFADAGLPLVAETLVFRTDTIKNERDKVKAYLKADIQGWYDAVLNPQKAVDVTLSNFGKDLGLDPAQQLKEMQAQIKLIVTPDIKTNGLLTISDELVKLNIDALNKAGYAVTAEQMFDLSLIEEVYKENPGLKKDLSSV